MRKVLAVALVMLLLAGSITYEGATEVAGTSRAIDVPVPPTANAGDLLLSVINNQRATDGGIVAPAGWTQVAYEGGQRATIYVFAKVATETEPAIATFTGGNGRAWQAQMLVYQGNWDSMAFTSATASGNGATLTAPNANAGLGDVRLAIFALERTASGGVGPAGMAQRTFATGDDAQVFVFDEPVPLAGPVGARDFTMLGGAKWAAATVILNEAVVPAGVTVTPTAGLTTTEAGGTDQFTVALDSIPAADVTIPVSSSDTTEGTVAPASLTFTTFNWDNPQTVTVTGVDDPENDGDIPYTIVLGPATSRDLRYQGFDASDVTITNLNDDVRSIDFVARTSTVTENAGQEYIPIRLHPVDTVEHHVKYGVITGTATAGVDYTLPVGVVTFAPGQEYGFIPLTIIEDVELEADETIRVVLSESSQGANLQVEQEHVLTIRDNEAPPRVQSGAIALYAFHEGEGSTVTDVSSGSMDLAIENTKAVTWVEDGLQIDSATTLSAGAGSSALHAALTSRNEVTFETWISPRPATQTGPARIMGLETSAVSGHQDIHIGQDGQQANFRLRTSVSNPGANLLSPGLPQTLEPIHVVVTHDGATKRIYIDGIEVSSARDAGDYSNWESTATFTLANSISGDRPWLGTLHGAAVYNRALNASEVAQNHASGLGGLRPALLRVETGVFDDQGIAGDGFWGTWNADPGASSVQGVNFLKITNLGDARGADAVIDFTDLQFTGVTDNRFGVPVANNVRYGYWEDDEPLMGRAPVDGAITWLPATPGAKDIIPVTGSDNVVYVTYEILQLPDILEDQQYRAAYTVHTVAA